MISSTDLPFVSVIIPTYNRCYCLHVAIESALSQTYKNTEIIIVDDGSTDNTKNVVLAFGTKVQYIQKNHSGQADSRNVGLQHAKGEFIASLDSDDVWNENYVEKSMGYILENKLDMFFSNWKHLILDTYRTNVYYSFLIRKKKLTTGCHIFSYNEFREILITDSVAASSGLIIRKDIIPFGWNSKINIGDDWYLQLEIIFKNLNCRVGFTKEVLWLKTRDATNICDGRKGVLYRKLHLKDLNLVLSNFSSYLDKNENKIINVKVLQNDMLIFYLLLIKGSVGEEARKMCIQIFKDPNLFITALSKGFLKQVSRKFN